MTETNKPLILFLVLSVMPSSVTVNVERMTPSLLGFDKSDLPSPLKEIKEGNVWATYPRGRWDAIRATLDTLPGNALWKSVTANGVEVLEYSLTAA